MLQDARGANWLNRHSKAKKLLPMPTGIHPWEEIAMDFVGELPESEGFNAIMVVTDRFTKMQRYLPAKTTWTTEDVAMPISLIYGGIMDYLRQ